MRFSWEDYLSLAKELCSYRNASLDDAAQRSAVSRAYYAAFWVARIFAEETIGTTFDSSRCHVDVIDFFDKAGHLEVARYLQDLKTWRINADYDADTRISHQNSISATRQADKVITILNTLRALNI